MRVPQKCRYQEVKSFLATSEHVRLHTSEVLHEDLGQDLVGVSLMLSAAVTKLRGHSVASRSEIDVTVNLLRAAVEKTRHIAESSRPTQAWVH